MPRIRKNPTGVDPQLLVKDAAKLMPAPTRRVFLRGGASLGALAFLTGCDIVDSASAEHVLMKISYFNDGAQAWLFNPNKLAPTYPDSAVRRPFPFNAYYPEEDAPDVDKEDYKLEVGGMVDSKKSWTLDELYALPQETQITRLICVEGWSAIGKWTGTPLREFLRRVGASADPDDLQVRRRDPAAQVRLPDEGADADQARLQESETRGGDGCHRQISRRILGGSGIQLVQRDLIANEELTPGPAAEPP